MTASVFPPSDGPWAEIDLSALCANFAMFRAEAPGAAVAAAVKCGAYGLGLEQIARALFEREHCDAFFVVYAAEGAALRVALNDSKPAIYCLAGPSDISAPLFESHGLTPVLNSIDQARLWATRNNGHAAALHIDTGMNRLGAPARDAAAIAALEGLTVSLVMSHLACASDPHNPKNEDQRQCFQEAAQHFPDVRRSLAASAGALMGKDYRFDMVRPGIGLYGGSPFDEDDARIANVVSLRAPVIQLRDLAPGESAGYGAAFTAARPTRLATVALGYGDGYPRNAIPAGAAMINSERAPVAGRVSMDFITLDVTDLKKPAKLHDIVEFFGSDLRLFEAAAMTGRAPYDLLTGLGARVDRRYL